MGSLTPRDPATPLPPGREWPWPQRLVSDTHELQARVRSAADRALADRLTDLGLSPDVIRADLAARPIQARYCWRCRRPILLSAWTGPAAGSHAVLLEAPTTLETVDDHDRMRVVARTDVAVVLCSAVPWGAR